MTNARQKAGTKHHYAYAWQGGSHQYFMNKDDFVGNNSFPSVVPSALGSWSEIPIQNTPIIDANTGAITGYETFTPKAWPSNDKYGWKGGTVTSNGKIYIGRQGAMFTLFVDPNERKSYIHSNAGQDVASSKTSAMVSTPSGAVINVPARADDLRHYDPLNHTTWEPYPGGPRENITAENTIGDNMFSYPGDTLYDAYAGYMFCTGIVAPNNGCIYMVPDFHDCVIKYNPVTYEVTRIGGYTGNIGNIVDDNDYNSVNGTGRNKFSDACLGPDGKIYMIGNYHRYIGVIDPVADTVNFTHKAYTSSASATAADSWYLLDDITANQGLNNITQACEMGPDGMIYILPDEYPWIMKYDPIANTFHQLTGRTVLANLSNADKSNAAVGTVDTSAATCGADQRHVGCVVGADGNIYAAPGNNDKLLKVYTGFGESNTAAAATCPAEHGYELIDMPGWNDATGPGLDYGRSLIPAPNGHLYMPPGERKDSPAPHGVIEIRIGVACKPAEWTYGPYVTHK